MIFNTFRKITSGGDTYAQVPSGARLDFLSGSTLNMNGTTSIGADAAGVDFTLYGAVTGYKTWWDANGDTNGTWYFGANTKGVMVYWYGDTTGYYTKFDPSGGTNGQWDFGADDLGMNVYMYGFTASKYCKWKATSDYLDVHGYQKVHAHDTTNGYAIEAKSNFNGTTTTHFGITSTVDYEPTGSTATAGGIQGLQGVGRLAASMTVTGGSIIGTYGQACNLGTINGSGIMVAGLYGLIEDGGTWTACSHVTPCWIDSHLAQTVTAGSFDMCYITNNGSTTANNAFYIYAGNKITNLFTIDTASGLVSDATTADYTFTKTRKIKVVAGGETGYLIMDII